MNRLLVTGSDGFIGYHLTKSLLYDVYEVLGIENINKYYDPALKDARISNLQPNANFNYKTN